MKQYRVRFYYGTDLRSEIIVSAYDDLKALAMALFTERISEWAIGPGFRVEIERA